jgi:hypothetical protein
MVQLSATRCSCIAILSVSLVSFAAITLCVASHRVFIRSFRYWLSPETFRYTLHAFLISAVDGGEWSASRPARFTPRERSPGTHWIGGWMGRRAVLDAVVKRKIPSPSRDSGYRPLCGFPPLRTNAMIVPWNRPLPPPSKFMLYEGVREPEWWNHCSLRSPFYAVHEISRLKILVLLFFFSVFELSVKVCQLLTTWIWSYSENILI